MLSTQLVGFTKPRSLFMGALVAVLAHSVLFCATSAATTTVIIDGDGFESVGLPPTGSGYDTAFPAGGGLPVGSLEGQHGSLPGDFSTAPWLASIGTDSTAVIQTGTVHSGSQALEVDRSTGDDPSFWGIPVTGWPDSARYICIEWDMYVETPVGAVGLDDGPYFGVDAIDDESVTGSDFGLLGSMGVVASSGEVVYTTDGLDLAPTGKTVTLDSWNHYHIDLDFELNEYTLYLNDPTLSDPLGPYPFVGGAAIGDGSGLDNFSDAPIGTFAVEADLPGTAYFDNYIVYQLDVKIPEPTTMVLSLVSLISISSVSRRRS